MKQIANLREVFQKADDFFDEKQSTARTARTKALWIDRRLLNAQAYFVIVFAQFENHINNQCRRLVTRKQAQQDWKRTRLWEKIRVNKIDNMPFMDRVSLLTKRGDTDYNRIKTLYDIRCTLAHGGTHPVNVGTQAADMYNLAKRLKG
jgi:phage-related protein